MIFLLLDLEAVFVMALGCCSRNGHFMTLSAQSCGLTGLVGLIAAEPRPTPPVTLVVMLLPSLATEFKLLVELLREPGPAFACFVAFSMDSIRDLTDNRLSWRAKPAFCCLRTAISCCTDDITLCCVSDGSEFWRKGGDGGLAETIVGIYG